MAASVLDSDGLHARLTEAERLAIAVLAREALALVDDTGGPEDAEVLPFRRAR
jgi:hypothetical protein